LSGGDAKVGADLDAEAAPRRPRDWLREQRGLPRRRLIAIGSVALVLFLVFSVLLARYLSTENVERADIFAVLRAEAAGNADGVISHLAGCREHAGCVAQAEQNVAKLRRTGSVKILTLSSQTAYAVTSDSGTTRVAWTVLGRLPTVQCVSVSRKGNFLSGLSVTLTGVSAPIPNEADC
jgi:predicted solute-binding protein